MFNKYIVNLNKDNKKSVVISSKMSIYDLDQ
jgi:hypothetical protein